MSPGREPGAGPSPLVLTSGDPAGIGPEVAAAAVAAALAEGAPPRGFHVVGPHPWVAELGQRLGVPGTPVGPWDYLPEAGRPDDTGARVAWEALEVAAEGVRAGTFRAAVTGPVSKARLAAVGWTFPGQTEFFAARWGGTPVMGFVGRELRVVLATWHIPYAAVPSVLTREVLGEAVEAAGQLARRLGAAEPRIAVCGLNPHAGEDGLLGDDERERLDPWLDGLRPRWPALSRCLPGDTVFVRHRRGEFDVAVALTHDQGLAPLKTVEFDEAVNVTLNLPWLRTSPDHGTAFGIAGKGVANPASFAAALALAGRLAP